MSISLDTRTNAYTARTNPYMPSFFVAEKTAQIAKICYIAFSLLGGIALSHCYPNEAFAVQILLLPFGAVTTTILMNASSTLAKTALLTSIYVLSSLTLGRICINCFKLSPSVLIAIRALDINALVDESLWITFQLGFILPIGRKLIKASYHLVTQSDSWKSLNRFISPTSPRSCLEVFAALVLPKNHPLRLSRIFTNSPLEMGIFLKKNKSLKSIKNSIEVIITELGILQAAAVPTVAEFASSRRSLLCLIQRISPSQGEETLDYLVDNHQRLMFNHQTLIPLQELVRNQETIQTALVDKLNQLPQWVEEISLRKTNLDEIARRLLEIQPTLERALSEKKQTEIAQLTPTFTTIYQDFNREKIAIEHLAKQIRRIGALKQIHSQTAVIRFNRWVASYNVNPSVNALLNNPTYEQEIMHLFSYVWGQPNEENPLEKPFPVVLQNIHNQLVAFEESISGDEDSRVTAYEHISSNCCLVYQDYPVLQEMLEIKELDEELFQEALSRIGLHTRKDLYEKQIIQKDHLIGSEQLLNRLRDYIKAYKADQESLRSTIYRYLSHIKDSSLFTQDLSARISRLIYRLLMQGMFFAPLSANPQIGLVSTAIGFTYYTVKPLIPTVSRKLERLLIELTLRSRYILSELSSRRAFSVTSTMRMNEDYFATARFEAKMRLLFLEVAVTGYACAIDFGASVQGVFLGRELSDIFIEALKKVFRRPMENPQAI